MDDQLTTALGQLWDSLSDEQKAKVGDCASMEELLAFVGEEKIELPDELMEAAGGYLYQAKDGEIQVIEDATGDVLAFSYEGVEGGGWEGLREFAKDFGQSTEVIDKNKLQFIRLMNQLRLGKAPDSKVGFPF